MANGKVYGSPVGYQAPSAAASQGRPRVGQASPEEIHRRLDAYEAHLRSEHAMVQKARAAVPRPRGSSAGPAKARGSVPGVDMAVTKAGG